MLLHVAVEQSAKCVRLTHPVTVSFLVGIVCHLQLLTTDFLQYGGAVEHGAKLHVQTHV